MFEGRAELRGAGERVEMTNEMIQEMIRCKEDILYFAENYFYIVSLDHGKIKIPLHEFQKRMLKAYVDPKPKRHCIALSGRQTGKTTISTIYILHYALFNDDKRIAILSNNEKSAREILSRVQMAYGMLPLWMQRGINPNGFAKGSLELENGVRIEANSTSSSSIRGKSINLLFLDEFAFVQNHIADEFISSVMPTISSGKTSKIIIVSTPNGLNHFFDIYRKALRGDNNYKPIKIQWYEVPGRDEQWKKDTIADIGQVKFKQEYACAFLGSTTTLIDSDLLERMETRDPLDVEKYSGALEIHQYPEDDVKYILGVDCAKGNQSDYSVIQVLKIIDEKNLEQVAVYRSNTIQYHAFAEVCIGVSQYYNDAYMMVENNDIGISVCNEIWNTHDCDRLLNCDSKGLGINANKKTKLNGNMLLKRYLEAKYLKVYDKRTIYELSRYEEVSPNVFKAANANDNDDCVTSLVWALYYLITPFFEGSTNKIKNPDEDDVSLGIIDDGGTYLDPGQDEDWTWLY